MQLGVLKHAWGKQPPTVASLLSHSGYVLGWEERESRGKDKGSNFGEKILRNQTAAPSFLSVTWAWFYLFGQRNLYNSGFSAGPQEVVIGGRRS